MKCNWQINAFKHKSGRKSTKKDNKYFANPIKITIFAR